MHTVVELMLGDSVQEQRESGKNSIDLILWCTGICCTQIAYNTKSHLLKEKYSGARVTCNKYLNANGGGGEVKC